MTPSDEPPVSFAWLVLMIGCVSGAITGGVVGFLLGLVAGRWWGP